MWLRGCMRQKGGGVVLAGPSGAGMGWRACSSSSRVRMACLKSAASSTVIDAIGVSPATIVGIGDAFGPLETSNRLFSPPDGEGGPEWPGEGGFEPVLTERGSTNGSAFTAIILPESSCGIVKEDFRTIGWPFG